MPRYVSPVETITDINGAPMVGAKLVFYEVGTTTKKTIYSDAGLSVPITNPVTAVSSDAGAIYPDIYLDGIYKVVQQDDSGTADTDDGAILWTRDPVGDITTGNFELWLNDETYNVPDVVYASDDNYYISLTDANQGNEPSASPASWDLIPMASMASTDGDTFTNTILTAPIITSPDIDQVVDSNGNEAVIFAEVASAVNELTITNAAAGNKPSMNQTGAGDVGVDIEAVELHNGVATTTQSIISAAAASFRSLIYQTAGSIRWIAAANATAETGSNVGSDYELLRYDDTGTSPTQTLLIARNSGLATFENLSPASLVTSSTLGAVGTYAVLGETTLTATAAGSTRAGSNLRYAGVSATSSWGVLAPTGIAAAGNGGTPAGTWMAMGYAYSDTATLYPATLWFRIS